MTTSGIAGADVADAGNTESGTTEIAESADRDRQPGIGSQIDWSLAASTAKGLARPGPKTTAYTYEAARAELADAATRAEAPVREVTGLADGLRVPTTRVLDRAGWIDAASLSMRSMLGSDETTDAGSPGLGARFGGLQAGGLLAFLSTAILGQYDPFTPDPETGEPGVLMVVTPNIINVERQLKVIPSDFRLWVCLHEVTHRVQFSANPWLRDYMQDNVAVLTSDAGESTTEIVTRMTKALKGSDGPREKGVIGAMQLLQSPEQHAAFQRMMVLGTLLEGHADHVMDAVGPAHVPSVASIRTAFDRRRTAPQNPVQRLIRALIGMDAKLAQYIRGKAFVDAVVEAVGMERFNTVWTSPDTMPLPNEIDDPQAWIQRVL